MATELNPLAQQRRLRTRLRQARTHAGLTQRSVAEQLDWSTSKVIRIETGAVGVSTTDLRALLQLYGITEPDRVAELVEVAKAARRKAWWDEYRDSFNPKLVNFVASEAGASGIRHFQSLVVPGALQTADYARAVLQDFGSESELVERAVRMRLTRQEGIVAEGGPSAVFVLDESVLLRHVGGPGIMQAQIEHLQELDRLKHIAIKVRPFGAGVRDGMQVSFTIFDFDDGPEHVVYVNQPGEDVAVKNDADEVCHYIDLFAELDERASALSTFIGSRPQ
ncbi:Helix-turn-helix domain-containing protein [Amycolatopsis pretoriensis]|uniref:Helix-turn-helix domain-containing protein n=1 Tax=Amycolatopsis pretoriensis TaxID=218821 RepID=A0A1H5QK76_9PSEU|nr:helix-turn-helix transcriptional regulator [Amycolatopsis pretoriensis]SEF26572.1 Helix-turn-helix domain-containing protein [Amycolatopsis pretoriensis]